MSRTTICLVVLALLSACQSGSSSSSGAGDGEPSSYYGTLEPFASEAIYFVLTDRFVNGDEENDYPEQGGAHGSFDRPLPECDGVSANVGYLGGDFRGLLDHADYIRSMGFTAVWITPIADNPDQAFTGGDAIDCDSILTDRGKTGYHGYWGVNFHRTDEHLVSEGLDFAGLTAGLETGGLKTVLDIVGNHGSPAWGMPDKQPEFGQLFDAEGRLVADHGNLPPDELEPRSQPLHAFFRNEPSLAQLGSFDADNPEVVDYLVEAYMRWLDQGADAFRVDTMAYMPATFWREVRERIEAEHPGTFMFGEIFSEDPAEVAERTRDTNGAFSVLDFPLQARLREVFEDPDSDYAELEDRLYLHGGPYRNVYELVTFYDNHDMHRLDADDDGLIDVHNWLFTARGIPAVYYGSEVGHMRGRREHAGNRNYFGPEGIARAEGHPVREQLARIARVRAESLALQRGLQVMLVLDGHRAAFYRVYQHDGDHEIALVLLNKGDEAAPFRIERGLQAGDWHSALEGTTAGVEPGEALSIEVPPHDVRVFLLDAPVANDQLRTMLEAVAQSARSG